MKQAVPLFGESAHNWRPSDGCSIRSFRCSECSTRFDVELSEVVDPPGMAPLFAGLRQPRCCPACGAIYDLSREQLLEQVLRCAAALNITPTTFLWILQATIATLKGGEVR